MIIVAIGVVLIFALLTWAGCPVWIGAIICCVGLITGLSGAKKNPSRRDIRRMIENEKTDREMDEYEDLGF